MKEKPKPTLDSMYQDDLDKDLHEHVKEQVKECLDHRSTTKFNDTIDGYEKRYKAMRSIRGLDYGDLPKTKPWKGCSDIGIPIEAITIQSIVARTDRVEWERLPLTHVEGVGPQDRQVAPKIEAYLDWQKLNKMKLRIPKMMATRRACIDGDYFWKIVFEEDYTYRDEMVIALRDPDTGELLKDETGELVEMDPETNPPLNESNHPYQAVPLEAPKIHTYYRGPKVYGRNVKQILWSPDETSPYPEDWDWWGDTYFRSIEWLKENSFEVKGEGGFRNVDKLILKRLDKKRTSMGDLGSTAMKDIMTKKVFMVEWYGKFKVKGKRRDVVIAYAPEEDVYMGWAFDEFKQRTGGKRLIHRQVIPMDGQVTGMNIPMFIKGLRDAIDVTINQMFDRGQRNNNPPIVYVKGSGFDPNVHNFGYRFWPEKESGQLRVLELPKSEQIEFAKIELLMGLVQRLFGVTDTTAGIENPNNTTATGITTLLAEGNVNIDMIISTLNESNIELDRKIIGINAMHVGQQGEQIPVSDDYSVVLEDPENPFIFITPEELAGEYNYIPTGSTLSTNTQSIRQEAAVLYKTAIESGQANPFVQDLTVLYEVTKDLFKSFGKKGIKIPTPEEIQAKILQSQADAMALAAQTAGQGGKAPSKPKAGMRI